MAVFRYQFYAQNERGDVIPGAVVTVRRESDSGIASIFSDSAGAVAKSNPFMCDDNGYSFFYAAPGYYRIAVSSGIYSQEWRDVLIAGNGRELLTANRTYYVRTDGNDASTGTVDAAGGAFLTIQKAIDTAAALDMSVYSVTVQIRSGTFNEALTFKSYVGAGPITIVGDTVTPSNVVLNATGVGITASNTLGKYRFGGFKIVASSHGLLCIDGSVVEQHAKMEWGACSVHKVITTNATFSELAGCDITGAAAAHLYMLTGAAVVLSTGAVNITGSPNFSLAFVSASSGSLLSRGVGYTYAANTATGTRYKVDGNAVLSTLGAGASFFPGNAAGTPTNGGQYL